MDMLTAIINEAAQLRDTQKHRYPGVYTVNVPVANNSQKQATITIEEDADFRLEKITGLVIAPSDINGKRHLDQLTDFPLPGTAAAPTLTIAGTSAGAAGTITGEIGTPGLVDTALIPTPGAVTNTGTLTPGAASFEGFASHGIYIEMSDSKGNLALTSGPVPFELLFSPGYREEYTIPMPFPCYFIRGTQIRFLLKNVDTAVGVGVDLYHYVSINLIGTRYKVPRQS